MFDQIFNAAATATARPTSVEGTARRRSIKSGADEMLEQEEEETEDQDEDILTGLDDYHIVLREGHDLVSSTSQRIGHR